ncbi:MAG: Cytochrome c oxidase subunit 5A [Peltula sp. TS41687]|nr:MAG: Cytochrome c oxidase subunit 5A [Peltula sp. TS41687]
MLLRSAAVIRRSSTHHQTTSFLRRHVHSPTAATTTTYLKLSSSHSQPQHHHHQQQQQRRNASVTAHAISNPRLANIEKRWEQMPPQEQAELWMDLRDRMRADWHELTWMEKKAGYWIAFGPHGPRARPPKDQNWRIFWATMAAVGLAGVIFAIIRQFANPPPRTMTREWQEKTNEYLKEQKVEPISGISSEGYKGTMVQSPPAKKQ